MLGAAGCSAFRRAQAPPAAPGPWHDGVPPMPIGAAEGTLRYVGNAACAECHPNEAREHAESHHAHTLAEMAVSDVHRYFDSQQTLHDRALGITYSVGRRDGQPILRVLRPADGATEELAPQWVVGSGRFGHTFLLEKGGRYMESRISYYPPIGGWSWTPGQQQQIPFRAPMGNVMPEGDTLACFACHSTYVVREEGKDGAGRIRADLSLFNVGCERCHGPGREHVESVRAGRGIGPLYTFREAGAATMMRLCGECHRGPEAVPAEELATHPDLPRFAGTALAASACYQKSAGRLTCITCHSPHARVSTDLAAYDRGCNACHDGKTPAKPACPVNPRKGCVNCHMPAESLGEPKALKFRNHWIRILPQSGE